MSAIQIRWRWVLPLLLVLAASAGIRLIAAEDDDSPSASAPADEMSADDSAGDSTEDSTEDSAADPTDVGEDSPTLADAAEDSPDAPSGEDSDSVATAPGGEEAPAEPAADEPLPTPAQLPGGSEPAPLANEAVEQVKPTAEDIASADEADGPVVLRPAASKMSVEAASFRGIKPGKTTPAELAKIWGAPLEIRKGGGARLQTYQIDNFPKVTVGLSSRHVTSVVVNLSKAVDPEELATELEIDNVSSVQVADEKGVLLGEAFPERGVLFGYLANSDGPFVSQIVLEPIDAAPFLLRAESHLRSHYARALADANQALRIDPESTQAQGLRARVYRRAGDYPRAFKAAEVALELEPDETDWKLLTAKILIETSEFERAARRIQDVLDAEGQPPLVRAKANQLMGDCIALAAGHDERAMKHYSEAIRLAEPVAKSQRQALRRGAKEVLLDAHLGVAQDVGWGHWQQKGVAIAKWAERSNALAKDLVQQEQGEDDLLLAVDVAVLSALAGVADPPDPAVWIADCQKRGAKLIEESPDEARTAQLHWTLGTALSDAAEIEQARGEADHALKCGRQALEQMEAGEPAARRLPSHDYVLGRLYYRLGVTAAVGKKNHKLAVEWYSRAVPLLEAPVPASRVADPGRHGETFVSIGVSYWDRGTRDEALRLTRQGIKLMETASEDGLLPRSALAIPYGNLASMHAELGDKKLAKEYAALAAKCERENR